MEQVWQTSDKRVFRTEAEAQEWEDLAGDRARIEKDIIDSGLVQNSTAAQLAEWLVDRAFIEAERARAKKGRKG